MKLQMKFQKILLLVSLILAAISIVYSFAYFTGSLSTLYPYVTGKGSRDINCADTYYFAQDFNGLMLILSIVYLAVIVAMYFMQCSKRRNYYITNYIVTIAAAVYIAVFAVLCIAMNAATLSMFLNDIDWEKYRGNYDPADPAYGFDDSVAMFALGFVLHVIVLLDAVALGLNLLWKHKLMKGEKQLLAQVSETTEEAPTAPETPETEVV